MGQRCRCLQDFDGSYQLIVEKRPLGRMHEKYKALPAETRCGQRFREEFHEMQYRQGFQREACRMIKIFYHLNCL